MHLWLTLISLMANFSDNIPLLNENLEVIYLINLNFINDFFNLIN